SCFGGTHSAWRPIGLLPDLAPKLSPRNSRDSSPSTLRGPIPISIMSPPTTFFWTRLPVKVLWDSVPCCVSRHSASGLEGLHGKPVSARLQLFSLLLRERWLQYSSPPSSLPLRCISTCSLPCSSQRCFGSNK